MRSSTHYRAVLLVFMLACWSIAALPPVAGAAVGDPLFIYKPEPEPPGQPPPPPASRFDGPCGLAVDAVGNVYISDYYHHVVDVYTSALNKESFLSQRVNVDPLDGPCGLAVGPAGNVYVNDFHRNVVRFGPAPTFGVGTIIAGAGVDASHPTGVAVDGAGTVYVDQRDRVATFDAAGVEGEPIGAGSIVDGYGIAVSAFPATAGFVYVPDAATDTVEIYDPATSRTAPSAEIDGSGTPLGHFVSLRDASVAVDNATGTVYVVDDLTPEYKEGHEAVVYAFGPTGAYLGRLKYAVQTALPTGLAVDNSPGTTQGRVYVTSGYTEFAEIYAYPPGSAGTAAVGLSSSATVSSSASVASPDHSEPSAAVTAAPAPSSASSVTASSPGSRHRHHHRHHRGHRGSRR